MFSTTITAPSTMMPKSMAPSESKLAGIPLIFSPMNVASSDSGITTATIAAGRNRPRNRNSTSRPAARLPPRFLNTVWSVLSMSQARS